MTRSQATPRPTPEEHDATIPRAGFPESRQVLTGESRFVAPIRGLSIRRPPPQPSLASFVTTEDRGLPRDPESSSEIEGSLRRAITKLEELLDEATVLAEGSNEYDPSDEAGGHHDPFATTAKAGEVSRKQKNQGKVRALSQVFEAFPHHDRQNPTSLHSTSKQDKKAMQGRPAALTTRSWS